MRHITIKRARAAGIAALILAFVPPVQSQVGVERTFKAGDSVLIEPGQVHEGINKGGVPMKALVTFIVQKGEPLRIPAA